MFEPAVRSCHRPPRGEHLAARYRRRRRRDPPGPRRYRQRSLPSSCPSPVCLCGQGPLLWDALLVSAPGGFCTGAYLPANGGIMP